MQNRINQIAKEYFDWNFFWNESASKQDKINSQAQHFKAKFPKGERMMIDTFRDEFPEAKISKFSYFMEEDRCLSYEITFEKVSYNCCISIFCYFIIYPLSGPKRYIDTGDNREVDELFHKVISKSFPGIEWISNEELQEPINHFNLGFSQAPTDEIDDPIYVGNLLTRFH